MEEGKQILYLLIASGLKPLAGYTPFQGEFIYECERLLDKCNRDAASMSHPDYKIYYLKDDNITYLIMTQNFYPVPAAVSCLESMKKEYRPDLVGRDFSKINNYGLNSQFKDKLRMKYDYYTENSHIVDEKLEKLKGVMDQFLVEVKKSADALDERGEKLTEMELKAETLEKDSYTFKKKATEVRWLECRRKWGLIVVIVLVVILIIGLLIWDAS